MLDWLPYRVQMLLGGVLGVRRVLFARRERHVTTLNIEMCLPELGERERRRLVRAHFASLGKSLFETALVWWASDRRLEEARPDRGTGASRGGAGGGQGRYSSLCALHDARDGRTRALHSRSDRDHVSDAEESADRRVIAARTHARTRCARSPATTCASCCTVSRRICQSGMRLTSAISAKPGAVVPFLRDPRRHQYRDLAHRQNFRRAGAAVLSRAPR